MAKMTKQQRRNHKNSGRSCSALNPEGIRRRLSDGTIVAPRSVRHKHSYYYVAHNEDFENDVLRSVFGVTRIAHRSKDERDKHHTQVNAFCTR